MDVKLPNLGEGADSGTVVNLFVKEGDRIEKDQPIVELENEKAVATIPSTAAGTISKVFVKNGDKVTVGQRLISINDVAKHPPLRLPRDPRKQNLPQGLLLRPRPLCKLRRPWMSRWRPMDRLLPLRPFAGWPMIWASTSPESEAASAAVASCWPTFALMSSG